VSDLNEHLLQLADLDNPRWNEGATIDANLAISNVDRTVGATLAGAIAKRWGDSGLPKGEIRVCFTGTAGQSFGAFAIRGMRFDLTGEANDYVGKGLGGGEIVVRAPDYARYRPAESSLMGNTVLYGATGGTLFAAGQAGERFAVRNSGATAVVEGLGDHGCEYMTGGVVAVLGRTGRNFGAGMTGGRAYVWDPQEQFPARMNPDLVRYERIEDETALAELHDLITQHVELTGSRRGRDLLHGWERTQHQFWVVLPKTAVKNADITATAAETIPVAEEHVAAA
jgi:glutamate synthase domain-containing protein 3